MLEFCFKSVIIYFPEKLGKCIIFFLIVHGGFQNWPRSFRFPNKRHSNETVNIFILKTIYFILQNMFQSLHTSSSVVHIKSTVNVLMIKGLLQCYSIVKNTFKNFYLTIFIAIKTNLMNMNKAIKTFYINY